MKYETVFRRYEMKYLITKKQKKALLLKMQGYMEPDSFGSSTICNVYFDTPNKMLIRNSLEKPIYKEKLRVRSYGVATKESTVFVEVKKKYEGVVYKRRLNLSEEVAFDYLLGGVLPQQKETQIMKELSYFMGHYEGMCPAVFLSYRRDAYFSKTDGNFRMTFDEDILGRREDLCLTKGIYGEGILPKGLVLLEVKTAFGIPLWLLDFFREQSIYKTSFSKYGKAYERLFLPLQTGGFEYAV